MKKVICTLLVVMSFLAAFSIPVYASDESREFSFELTVDGQDTKEVKTGDIITVGLKLKRVDSAEPYMMYGMQDEIRYDSAFFELVEDSAVLNSGVATTDIEVTDQYREFYMNYLSMSGGTQWEEDMLVGSVQLRVIGETGVTKITNQDYLVSVQDGTDSYLCDASDVTIILSTECVVSFKTNGGNEIPDQKVQYGEKIICPDDPVREGYRFDGWYTDIDLTDKWNFDKDLVQSNMSLYAKWTEGDSNMVQFGGCIWWWIILIIILVISYVIYRRKKQNRDAS